MTRNVAIVGSGVIGLSIALQLKTQGDYQVTIIARELSSGVESRQFASPWAGANWASTTMDKKQQIRDEATFKQWQKWAKTLPLELIAEMPFVEYFHPQGYKEQVDQWRSKFLPEYRSGPSKFNKEEIAIEHSGYTMNAPQFLAQLEKELQSPYSDLFPVLEANNGGGSPFSNRNGHVKKQKPVYFIRANLTRLSDALEHVPNADLIVNATGLGSSTLKDVLDETVYPIRGQTVLIKASKRMKQNPYCAMKGPKNANFNVRQSNPEDQEFTYIIPRAKSGEIICGGCAIPNDWNTTGDSSMSQRILQRCIELVPELLEEGVDPSCKDAWKSITILNHGLGLRPARQDGMRIELQELCTSNDIVYHVLHCYGAGSGGYQSGYGVTLEAYQQIEHFFGNTAAKKE